VVNWYHYIILLIPVALSSIVKSNAVALINDNNYSELHKILFTVNLVNIIGCSLIVVVIILFTKTILLTFGSGFDKVYIPLIIQTIAYFIVSVFTPAEKLLTLINVKKEIKANILQLVILIILGSVFTYYWGVLGITVALMFSVCMKYLFVYVFLKKCIPIKPLIIF